jgi:hypothetical protein
MGLLKSEWPRRNRPRGEGLSLTAKGRRQLDAEIESWGELSTAIALVLGNLAPGR